MFISNLYSLPVIIFICSSCIIPPKSLSHYLNNLLISHILLPSKSPFTLSNSCTSVNPFLLLPLLPLFSASIHYFPCQTFKFFLCFLHQLLLPIPTLLSAVMPHFHSSTSLIPLMFPEVVSNSPHVCFNIFAPSSSVFHY